MLGCCKPDICLLFYTSQHLCRKEYFVLLATGVQSIELRNICEFNSFGQLKVTKNANIRWTQKFPVLRFRKSYDMLYLS